MTTESTRHATQPSPPVARLPDGWNRGLTLLAFVGVAVAILGLIVAPERGSANVLVGAFYVLGLGLAGLLFVAFQNVTSASWSVVLRRVPEAMALTLPVAAVLSIAVLALIPLLYEWSHADAVAADPLLEAKSGWLNPAFFAIRTIICTCCWLLFAYVIVLAPRRRESTGDRGRHRRPVGASGAFLLVFAITFSVVCFDWIMSLEPHWFSTVFAVYNFSGLFLGGLAAITFFVIILARLGPLREVIRPDHLHDLGKLLISFSTFWAYIWFCQYMLIWYTNIPEETSHFIVRQEGTWGVLFVLNLLVNWLIPFLVLLPRGAKRSTNRLLTISSLLIAGRWLDLYLMIEPSFHREGPQFGVWEIFPVLGILSIYALVFFRILGRTPVLPATDPRLPESLHYHQ